MLTHRLPKGAELFGRTRDLNFLHTRVVNRGLTVISGRPKIGKTWLLRALCDELIERDWLIGYYESTASENDVLSHALEDLYTNWLKEASYRKKIKNLLKQCKKDYKGTVGSFIIDSLSDIAEISVPVIGNIVSKGIRGLKTVGDGSRPEFQSLPAVPYDIVKELVIFINQITEQRPILLVLDAWEQGQNLDNDYGSLRKFLSNAVDWPQNFHVIIAVRNEPKYDICNSHVKDLCDSSHAAVMYNLGAMDIDNEPGESQRLVHYLQKHVPICKSINPEQLLNLISGNPAILDAWISSKPESTEALTQLADDANRYRYRELETYLADLIDSNRSLFEIAARLAMLSELITPTFWEQLRPIVLKDAPDFAIADLESRGVLIQGDPPSFGHTTRYEAARQWLFSNNSAKPHSREFLKSLIHHITISIHEVTEDNELLLASLAMLLRGVIKLDLQETMQAVPCVAACTIFDIRINELQYNLLLSKSLQAADEFTESKNLISLGLLNTINQAIKNYNPSLRDASLQKLRELHEIYHHDTIIVEYFTEGLLLVYHEASEYGDYKLRDKILQDLRELQGKYPDNLFVREKLVTGLIVPFWDPDQESGRWRCDNHLEEFRNLQSTYPTDTNIRHGLAQGLSMTISWARSIDGLQHCDTLLHELRELNIKYTDDLTLMNILVKGIVTVLQYVKYKGYSSRYDILLQELRDLYQDYPDNTIWHQFSEILNISNSKT